MKRKKPAKSKAKRKLKKPRKAKIIGKKVSKKKKRTEQSFGVFDSSGEYDTWFVPASTRYKKPKAVFALERELAGGIADMVGRQQKEEKNLLKQFFEKQKAVLTSYCTEVADDLCGKYFNYLLDRQDDFYKNSALAADIAKEQVKLVGKRLSSEAVLFKNSKYPVAFKPFQAVQGLAVVAFFVFFGFSFIFDKTQVNPERTIQTAQIRQVSPIVAGGKSVQWTVLIDKSKITKSNNLLALPKNARNIKVKVLSQSQKADYLASIETQRQTQLTTKDRKQLAGMFDVDFTGISVKNTSTAGLAEAGQFIVRLLQATNSYVLADLEEAVSNIVEEAADANSDTITETPTATVVDLSEQVATETETPENAEPTIPTGSNDVAQEPLPVVETPQEELETIAEPQQETVVVEYETPAPTITEQETNTGKLVTISAPTEESAQETPSGSSDVFAEETTQAQETTYTNVIASTKIPEIYKVGQEDKIKLKWKNNGEQAMEFHAYDLNNNGKLDYVEWIVPHLSDQIFEIIFISKAWLLDSSKEIQEDIYDTVKQRDSTWQTVQPNNYIRVTFYQELDETKDITIYAKASTASTVQVYPVYTDQDGNQVQGSLLTTFPEITTENSYKVLLTGLATPTNTFDLRITKSAADIDYIVDPAGWLTSWAHRKKITIDKTNVSSSLSDFPLLVKFTADTNVGASALSTGYDVRFTDSDGYTLLKYERESWTGGNGASATGVFWVKVPTISSSADTDIYMYYGNDAAADGADPANVWDSSFAGVWHLPDGSTLGALDSTSNNNDGTISGATATTGKVDGAATFTGSSQYITTPVSSTTNTGTASFWVKADSWGASWPVLMAQADLPNAGYLRPGFQVSESKVGFFSLGSNVQSDVLSTGTWHSVVGVWDAVGKHLYIDGQLVREDTSPISPNPEHPWEIGDLWYNSTRAFQFIGLIDEPRISSTARSAAWTTFEYNNMSQADNELTLGAEENNLVWLAGWSYRKKIVIDHTKVGATTEDETNFPVLISLTGLSNINANGTDIRFTTDDGGTYLAREIESYSSGSLTAWVKIPTLSHDYDTTIYMYYGNTSATEPAASSTYGKNNVWDSNFKGVWHLNDPTNPTDSTSNANNGTNNGSMVATGQVGGAANFYGGVYIDAGSGNSLLGTDTFTVSTWGKYTDTGDMVHIARFGASGRVWDLEAYSGNMYFGVSSNGTGWTPQINTPGTYNDGNWHYFSATYTASTKIEIFVDGTSRVSSTTSIPASLFSNSDSLTLGKIPVGNSLTGNLDETRVSSVARSAGWIATEYANQNSPSTFYTDYAVESNTSTWLSGYKYRKRITIDNANVDAELTNFPLLVKFTSDSSLSTALSTGYDVRFTSSDALTLLSYERESWSGGNGSSATANFWVKVPTISTTADTDIYMYYGKSDATDGADPTNVWDSNFKGVWHLNETGTNPTVYDSTSNNNDSNAQVWTPLESGKISRGATLNGTNQYIRTSATNFPATNAAQTQSVWAYYSSTPTAANLTTSIGTENGAQMGFQSSAPIVWKYGGTPLIGTSSAPSTSAWHLYTFATSGSSHVLYIDGASVATGTVAMQSGSPTSFYLGTWDGSSELFAGNLDEARVSNVARSVAWIKFEYNNMNSADNELSIEGSSSSSGITWTNSSGDNKWSTASNWQGGVVPSTNDNAIFNQTATANCTIDTNISVKGINIASGYTGTITQSGSYTVTVGSDGFTQAGGTFTGGSGGITLNGNYTLTGGTFNAGSGTITITGGSFAKGSTATFNAQSGIVNFYNFVDSTYTISGAVTFNNLTFQQGGCCAHPAYTLDTDQTYTVLGTLNFAGGGYGITLTNGTIEAKGNVSLGTNAWADSTTLLVINGTGNQTLAGTGQSFLSTTINKDSGTLLLADTITVIKNWSLTKGNVDPGTSTVVFEGGAYSSSIAITGSQSFYNLTFLGGVGCCGTLTATIDASTTLTATGLLRFSPSGYGTTINGGKIAAQGNVSVSSGSPAGTSELQFTGTANQTYASEGGSAFGSPVINKPSGTVTLASDLTLSATGQDLTITSGTLDLNGKTLTVNDVFSMGGATLIGSNGLALTKNITLTGNSTVRVDSTNTFTMSGIISDGAGTYSLTKTGTGTLTLSGNNTFDGGVIIKSGTVAGGNNVNNFGAGTITIGDTSGSANATLDLHNGANTTVFPNPISVASGNTGTAKIISYFTGATLDHAITLPTSPATHDLTLAIEPTLLSYTSLTISGGITGTGNITINNNGINDGILLSTTAINNTGTITNSNAGSYGATTTISAVIGANVTGITQNSASSALTLSGVNTYAGPITNSAGTLNLTQTTTYSTMTLGADTTTNFTNGKTFTLTNLVSNGTSGHLATIQTPSAGNYATLTSSTPTISVNYTSIKDSHATGGAIWSASLSNGNVDVSGNTGWIFDSTPPTISYAFGTPSDSSTQSSSTANVIVTSSDNYTNHSVVNNWNSSLAGWWRMDDVNGSGNPTDYIGSNNGTKSGSAAQTASGKFGKGFAFTGGSDYVSLGSPASLGFTGTAQRTVSAWINTSTVSSNWLTAISGDINSTTPMYRLQLDDTASPNRKIAFVMKTSAGADAVLRSSSSISASTWYHVVGVYTGTQMILYLNGSSSGTPITMTPATGSLGEAVIGNHSGHNQGWNGTVDDVTIFNRALSSDEVLALYDASANQYSHSFTGLTDGTYTFKTYAQDLAGNVANITQRSFTVQLNQAPNAPTLVSPANASYTADNTPTLSANYSDSDTGDTGTTNYRISTSSLSDCAANTNVVAWGTSAATTTNNESTTWTPASSIGNSATYYWCAQNSDGVLTSSWTQMGSFTLDTVAPITAAAAGSYTFNTETNLSPTVTLSCTDVNGSGCAVTYYCTDTDNTCTPTTVYASPVVISTQGTSYIRYYSTDLVSNAETASSQTIILDSQAPTLAEVTPVSATTTDITPDYTFSATEAGTITYGGSCSSSTTAATVGNNTITFNALSAGTHSDCTITVTDSHSNVSSALSVTSFTVQTATTTTTTVSEPGGNSMQVFVNQVVGQAQNVIKNIIPQSPQQETQTNYPPIEVSVPQEPQWVFKGQNIVTQDQLEKIEILPLPEPVKDLAIKFPKFAETLQKVGINTPEGVKRLETVSLSFPGVSQAAGLNSSGVALSQFTEQDKKNIPSNITFARTGNDNIDLNIQVNISSAGEPIQTVSTIQNKPVYLVIKPDKEADSVKGYVIFKSANLKAAFVDFSKTLSASLMDATNLRKAEAEESSEQKDIVLSEFNYEDSDNDGIYTATINSPAVDGKYEIRTEVLYHDNKNKAKTEEISMIMVVDPEGYIYEKSFSGNETRIANAKASIYWLNPKTNEFELWPAKDYQQINPQVTDNTGKYSFLVPEGKYYIKVEAGDYSTYEGQAFDVVEGSGVHQNIQLKPKNLWGRVITIERAMLGVIIILLTIISLLLILRRQKNGNKK